MTSTNPLLDQSIMDVPYQTLSTGTPVVLLDFADVFKRHDKRRKNEQKEQNAHATMSMNPLMTDMI